MNPYGQMSSIHSSWPVLLCIYNLSPTFCMKRKYIMLSMIISGPKQPGNDIDTYLSPLIEELKVLWVDGVDVYDDYRKDNFKLRAMIFCTINDFPAYENLSGYSVKGKYACPICMEGTCSQWLKHGKKTVYMGHRRFLKSSHRFRKYKVAFDGKRENAIAPEPLTGDLVFNQVQDVHVVLGKFQKEDTDSRVWKKRSIFWSLPYW